MEGFIQFDIGPALYYFFTVCRQDGEPLHRGREVSYLWGLAVAFACATLLKLFSSHDVETQLPNADSTVVSKGDDSPASLSSFEIDEPTEEERANLRIVSDKIPWAAFLVAMIELCERFTYYGLSGPFQNYIQRPYKSKGVPGALGWISPYPSTWRSQLKLCRARTSWRYGSHRFLSILVLRHPACGGHRFRSVSWEI